MRSKLYPERKLLMLNRQEAFFSKSFKNNCLMGREEIILFIKKFKIVKRKKFFLNLSTQFMWINIQIYLNNCFTAFYSFEVLL